MLKRAVEECAGDIKREKRQRHAKRRAKPRLGMGLPLKESTDVETALEQAVLGAEDELTEAFEQIVDKKKKNVKGVRYLGHRCTFAFAFRCGMTLYLIF